MADKRAWLKSVLCVVCLCVCGLPACVCVRVCVCVRACVWREQAAFTQLGAIDELSFYWLAKCHLLTVWYITLFLNVIYLFILILFSPQLVVTVLSHRCNFRMDSGEAKVESRASSKHNPTKTHCFNPEASLTKCVVENTVHLATATKSLVAQLALWCSALDHCTTREAWYHSRRRKKTFRQKPSPSRNVEGWEISHYCCYWPVQHAIHILPLWVISPPAETAWWW
jgi:hypothetical protein